MAEFAQLVDKYGIPVIALIATVFALVYILNWVRKRIVDPALKERAEVVASVQKTQGGIVKTLRRQTQLLRRLVQTSEHQEQRYDATR